MGLAQALGRGAVSRGRITIDQNLFVNVTTAPYLHDENDFSAVVESYTKMVEIVKKIPGATLLVPPPDVDPRAYLESVSPPRSLSLHD